MGRSLRTRNGPFQKAASSPALDWPAFLACSTRAISTRQYRPKEILYRQGDPAEDVYFIKEGMVQLTVVSSHGRMGIIAMPGPGEFVGESALAGPVRHKASAIVVKDSVITRIDKHSMARILGDVPELSERFRSFLLARNSRLEADLIDHMLNSSERRLARVLLQLANDGKLEEMDTAMTVAIPKVSQDMLAARIGTTRARVNFFMNKFRRLGFVEYKDGLKIKSSLLDVTRSGESKR